MLTPDKIKEYRFQPAGQGVYRADDVDRFFSSVSADYETVYTEHGKLIDRVRMLVEKIKSLEAQIQTYEEQENLIKKTLIVAQKKADEIESSAKTRSESRTAAADKEAAEKVAAAEKHAKELLSAAEERSKRIMAEVEQKSRDILSGAGATAEKTIGTAKGRATLMLTESKQRAEKIIADAKAQADAVLGPLQAEVAKEKKALEEVRAESKAFKKKITESYYQQIGMTSELLGFVETEEPQTAPVAEEAPAAPVQVQTEQPADSLPQEDLAFLDAVDTYVPAEDDLFTAILEETVTAEEPVAEEPAPEEAVAQEPAAEVPVAEEEPAAEEPQEEEHFSFVGGFDSLGFEDDVTEDEQEIPEEPLMNFDDIFNSAIAETPEQPQEPPKAETDKPFGQLNEKYRSVSQTQDEEQEDELTFGSIFRKPAPEPVQEPTRQITLPQEAMQDEEDEEEVEIEQKKPEKKKHRLSLFSKYEDEDEDDDDYDDDEDYDDEDDEDDDEESGGFKGFFRK
ncbi:MAG: DivIVA domain-containing protein [Acutalibacteraceae bacterium]